MNFWRPRGIAVLQQPDKWHRSEGSEVRGVKQADRGDNVDAIKQAINNLQQASHAMAQHLYSKAQAGGPGATPGGGPAGDGRGGAGNAAVATIFGTVFMIP